MRFCGMDGTALIEPTPVRTDHFLGKVVGDGWCLRAELGRGAFGTVYAGTHADKPGEFAVKVMRSSLRASEEQVGRFRREVRILSELRDPYLIEIVGFGHDDQTGYYVVMPRLHGRDLARHLRDVGPLSLPEFDALLRQIATALGTVHRADIVHRDIKAENIFLIKNLPAAPDGLQVRLLDFGLAKLIKGQAGLSADDLDVSTRPTQVLGSPATMAPEQVLSQDVDSRADLYSLGIVLFEALTGRLPFEAPTPVLIMRQHVFEPPPAPSTLAGWVPPELDALVLDLLHKRPSQRIGSTSDLLTRWEAAGPAVRAAWQRA